MFWDDEENEIEFNSNYIKLLKKKRNIRKELWEEYSSDMKIKGYRPIIKNYDGDDKGVDE